MTHKKIWALYKPDATEADATFIMGLGCQVEVIIPTPIEFISPSGAQWHYRPDNTHIEITTTCKKQEAMLYLKYGDELCVKRIIHDRLKVLYG